MTPADFHPEDADAFDRGVLTGKDAAFKGLPFPQPCVDLNVAGPSAFHLSPVGDEAALAVWELAKGAFAGAVASGVLLVVELSIGRETFSDDPDAALARQATALQDLLRRMRILTGELSLGGAVDLSVAGCELLLTPVFREQSAAVASALALGRSKWLVASWGTDEPRDARIVGSN